jgi:DNA-directed RNA polymerase specialized sigma subunit|tara:strand:- start:92 stop:394 length:303 start_codon:yes stop_codon:yes gene_type:complete
MTDVLRRQNNSRIMLEDIPDNGYELAEELEQAEKAKERLLWINRGFAWCYKMTERQREVAYYKLFTDKTEEDIGKILNIDQSVVNRNWHRAIKQGSKVVI